MHFLENNSMGVEMDFSRLSQAVKGQAEPQPAEPAAHDPRPASPESARLNGERRAECAGICRGGFSGQVQTMLQGGMGTGESRQAGADAAVRARLGLVYPLAHLPPCPVLGGAFR